MNEDVETLGDVLIDHGPSGFINSRRGFVKCLCGARLYCAFEDGQPDYAYEAAARAEHLAEVLAPLLDQARRDAAEKAWDESHEAACMYPYHFPEMCAQNPYRAVASHQEGGA